MYDVCNGSGTGSVTLQLTVGSGNAGTPQGTTLGDLVVVCANSSNSFNVTNVTDTKANAYTAAVSDSATGNQGAIWSSKTTAALVAGTDKITVTFSGSTGQQNVIVQGASGVSSGTADQTAHAGASSTAPDAGATGPLSQANELVVAMIGNANTGGIPTGLSWGGAGTSVHASGTGPYLTVFTESVSATGALDASGTLKANASWCCLTATFKLSGGALSVTSTSPPAGTVGTSYNSGTGYTLTATGGTAPYAWSVKTGPLPPGLTLSPGAPGGHICGVSIKQGGSTAAEVALYNTWNGAPASGGLGLYTAQARKVYFTSPNGPAQTGSFPVNATAALWKANNPDVGAALTNGMGMHLCYRPLAVGSSIDPGWPGGAHYPAPSAIATEYALLKASIQSLQAACASVANGASVLSVILWQENDNKSGFPGAQTTGGTSYNAFVASHTYFAYYPLLKADFPNLPVYVSYVNYPHGTAAQDALDRAQRFPGPHPLNPAGWGTATVNGNVTNLFCDGITTDEYADGAYGDSTPSGTLSTNPTGRLRYMYAEPDLYTPPAGSIPASGNPGWADVADWNGIGWGNLETGNNASTGQPDLLQMQAYLAGVPLANPAPVGADKMVHSILQVYQTRVANNAPLIGMCWYENAANPPPPAGTGYNNIISSSDARIPWLNAIDAATAASTGSIIGGTLTTDGTVTYPHAYPVTVQVKDASGTKATALLSFSISTGTVTLAVTTGTLATGTSGQAYSQQLLATGGTGTGYTWTLNAGSLAGSGITLSAGGLLSGTAVTGTYTGLQFKVTDSGSNTALSAAGMVLTVQASSTVLTINNTSPLPSGTTGITYADLLTAANGTPPYSFFLAPQSALPPGLSIVNTAPIDDEAVIDLQGEDGVDIVQEA